MKKTILTRTSPLCRMTSRRSLFTGVALLGMAVGNLQAQDWIRPYSIPSVADDIIRFDNGPAGNVTAPAPGTSVLLAYNNTPQSGSAGGWSLTSTGAASIGAIVVLGSTETRTQVSENVLDFRMVTSGIGNLVGLNLAASWEANATITGSDSWTPPTNFFAYNFDIQLNSSLVSLSPGLFDAITLTIREGANTVYSQTGLAEILNIVSITSSSYTDVMVPFNYNPDNGPLSIEWSASTLIQLPLLNIIGGGNSLVYSVQNPGLYVDAIPEPSTYALLVGAVGMMALLRRRSRANATA